MNLADSFRNPFKPPWTHMDGSAFVRCQAILWHFTLINCSHGAVEGECQDSINLIPERACSGGGILNGWNSTIDDAQEWSLLSSCNLTLLPRWSPRSDGHRRKGTRYWGGKACFPITALYTIYTSHYNTIYQIAICLSKQQRPDEASPNSENSERLS